MPKAKPKPLPAGDGLLNIRQAAAHLGIATVTLRLWSVKGKIGFVQLGRRKLFHRDELARFIATHTVPAGGRR